MTIVGASGGVGHYAVQLAHAAGAHATAVCGPANAALVRELGAERVVDYRAVHWPEAIRGQDVVFDTVGSVFVQPRGRDLDAVAQLLASGEVRSVIDEIYPLAQTADAHRRSRSLHTRGKLVLNVRPS